MLPSLWFLFSVPLLIMLNYAGRREMDKRNFCAVLSQMWYKIDFLSRLCCRKACSKGAIQYGSLRTCSQFAGEDLEKTGVFVVWKSSVFAMSTYWKNSPRARDADQLVSKMV
ncbi:hypothetical protein V202x_42580 [Gimesia aquarii]|uniref:Uncharacterized protein n=1 Tax=Gimesia aquarii TaxID=2527964 RepID=A0A517X016_9PLAN|nr:hypothetical protein V202x_42580 [Gimesia aquarii]